MKRTTILSVLGFAAAAALAAAQQPQTAPDTQPPAPITRSAAAPDAPQAGPRRHHQPDPHREALMLSRRLNLTPDQTAKLEPILADRQQKMAAIHANTALNPQDMHQQMRTLREQEKSQLASILTPDQQRQLKEMRRGRRGQDHDGPTEPQTPGLL